MKRYIAIILIFALSTKIHAAEVYNLNRTWKFFSSSEQQSDNSKTVNLPHTWNTAAAGENRDFLRNTGNYLKDINLPSAWSGQRVFIRFKGSNSATDLIVNGRLAGQHRGGYTAFTFEITNFVKFGTTNSLWVIVNNSPQSDILPTAGDANSYGGLFRDVELIVTKSVTIALTDYSSCGVYVSSFKNSEKSFETKTTVKLSSTSDKTVQVAVSLINRDGKTVARQEDRVKVAGKGLTSISIPFTVEYPRLWNGTEDPYLYDLCVKVSADGILYDSVVVQTGYRDFGFDPSKGFMLNGKPYKIKGVSATQDRAMAASALHAYQIEEDVELIRQMGANMVNVSGVPHNPAFYDLCDRAGIMVWSDLPFNGAAYLTDRAFFNTSAFMKNGKDQLVEIIRQQYNHPSVVMWGLFNCLNQRGDDPLDYIKELQALAKKEDPSRYTVATSNQDGDINFVTDLILWRHHFGWNEGMPEDISIWLPYLHKTWGSLSSAVSYGAGASIDHQSDSLFRPSPASEWHPERWQTHLHEEYYKQLKNDNKLWGIFVNNMFDYGAAGYSNGINDMGLVTFDRKYLKDAYYFYKANWDSTGLFVHIAERRWDNRKNPVQKIKVFSNCQQVELIVNGVSQGVRHGDNGTFLWTDVKLYPGSNTIKALSAALSDNTVINIASSQYSFH